MLPDIICLCHLRWNFVYQRPQHLLTRFAAQQRVFLVEDPIFDAPYNYNEIYEDPSSSVCVVVPHLQSGLQPDELAMERKILLGLLMDLKNIETYILWYYSPMALSFTHHLKPEMIVYDCMDELSAFKFAPPSLKSLEKILMYRSDIVFTGGYNLYHAKKDQHYNIFPLPSSIDKEHFALARRPVAEPDDQKDIPSPRIGFYGVVDERFDIDLLAKVAEARPEWNFIVIGPIVKIDPANLPQATNIHYLGPKQYKELPSYLGGWDIAMMPFALNESTTYISPTKTPEYLAGGKPVISTAIVDVVEPYGKQGLVHIANDADAFVQAAEQILSGKDHQKWLSKVDEFLFDISWNKTWKKMNKLIQITYDKKSANPITNQTHHYV